MVTFSMRLPEELLKRLDRLAVQTGRTKTFYVKEALLKHLEVIEHLYRSEQRLIYIDQENKNRGRIIGNELEKNYSETLERTGSDFVKVAAYKA